MVPEFHAPMFHHRVSNLLESWVILKFVSDTPHEYSKDPQCRRCHTIE